VLTTKFPVASVFTTKGQAWHMNRIVPVIAATAITFLQACNGLPPTIPAPGPFVAEELIGEWRVVSLHHDGTAAIDPAHEDGIDITVSYTSDSLQIDNGCAPAERALYANYGLYEMLAIASDHIDTCVQGSDEDLHLFDLANPIDGYYHVFEDQLQLFDIRHELRVTLERSQS
jgi:hypothetical protein